jgi:hypothetical protein
LLEVVGQRFGAIGAPRAGVDRRACPSGQLV